MADNGSGWAEELVKRIGAGVKMRRSELGLSAQAVADRTVELGHPIGRGAIARLETASRGMVDVAELLVLAKALQTSPVALLWHDAADAPANVLPDIEGTAGMGLEWTVGDRAIITAHEWDVPEEHDRQGARLRALWRLNDARRAIARASQRRHPARGGDREDVDMTALYSDLARAEDEAKTHGWIVRHG